jgi:hypothetical protein
MNRQLLSFFLILCLFGPMVGSYTYVKHKKWKLKRQIKQELIAMSDEKEFVHLSFKQSEIASLLEWEHSKEFRFKGEMYDVIRVVHHADSVTYICWWDKAETKLNRQLESLLALSNGKDDEQKNTRNQWERFIKCLYAEDVFNLIVSSCYKESSYSCFQVVLCSIDLMIESPPPREI